MIIKKITNGIYGGSQPMTDAEYNAFRQLGTRSILKLNHRDFAKEKLFCLENDIEFYYQPLSGIYRPTHFTLQYLAVNIEKLYQRPVYIHCTNGMERKNIVVAEYRIFIEGDSVEEAWKECKKNGFRWWIPWYWTWKKSLKEVK